tara:strand:- start:98 stop:823 length:726 start_codon:yes stop_codon:yes gene_type:complete
MTTQQKNIPNHIAVIMDGNGRWAKKKGKERIQGHKKGILSVRKLVEEASKINISYLTLFAFSTENWKRPKNEVSTLMDLIVLSLDKELKTIIDNKIKLNAIGDINSLPKEVKKKLKETIKKTKNNRKLTLTIAINYGGKEEITNAVNSIINKVKKNIILEEKVDEELINTHLYSYNLPDVDLLIRTSGEKRISNFLLWKISYAELYFTNILWPEFSKNHFYKAIINYQKRERRFGKTSEQV